MHREGKEVGLGVCWLGLKRGRPPVRLDVPDKEFLHETVSAAARTEWTNAGTSTSVPYRRDLQYCKRARGVMEVAKGAKRTFVELLYVLYVLLDLVGRCYVVWPFCSFISTKPKFRKGGSYAVLGTYRLVRAHAINM